MKLNLTKYAPPGQDIKEEKGLFALGMSGAVIFSMGYLVRYAQAWSRLYEWKDGRRIKLTGMMMPEFSSLLENALIGFWLVAVFMLGFVVYHYMYYYKDSKSVYLMKRLPDKFKICRSCISIPLMAASASVVTAMLMTFIYFLIYILFTPGECIMPGQWLWT